MTDAPERIWLDTAADSDIWTASSEEARPNETEYVRADLTPRWQPIDTAPDLERVLICGWQPQSGTVAGYWWWEEGCCQNGQAIERTGAMYWAPIQLPVFPTPPEAT